MDIVEKLRLCNTNSDDEAADEIESLRAHVAALTRELKHEKMNTAAWQRDAKGKLADRTIAYHALAASQAREKVLLDILAKVQEHSHGSSVNYAWCKEALALALPQDTTALDELLAKERERCAKVCESQSDLEYATGKVDHNERAWCDHLAAAIRSLK